MQIELSSRVIKKKEGNQNNGKIWVPMQRDV